MAMDARYWAGFFDGEGSVSINSDGRVRISITQKSRPVLELAMEQYGGRISDTHGVDTSAWVVDAAKYVKAFLTDIYPHSVVKRAEIEVGLEAVELIRENNLGCKPLTDQEVAERLKLRLKLQAIRPKKTFRPHPSLVKIRRGRIKEQHDHKCSMCGDDLRDTPPQNQVIRDDKLFCRKCHGIRCSTNRDFKPVSAERITEVISQTDTLDDACVILGVNRSSLYMKRRKYGLPMLRPQKL